MSERPTEPGYYWWKADANGKWAVMKVVNLATGLFIYYPGGYAGLDKGEWGPRIEEPDEK